MRKYNAVQHVYINKVLEANQSISVFELPDPCKNSNAEQSISLEECKLYFESQPDFTYSPVLNIVGAESTMTIEGTFLCGTLRVHRLLFVCTWGICM